VTATATAYRVCAALDAWDVEVLERRHGLTSVDRRAADVRLRVGDRHTMPRRASAPDAGGELRSLLVAQLSADGTVWLVTHCAPPALVVTRDEVHALPTDGRTECRAELEDGDLLMMFSATTLDDDPGGLVDILAAGPGPVRHRSPDRLVRHLLRGSLTGAAAVARYNRP
jgi:hypothetical protein